MPILIISINTIFSEQLVKRIDYSTVIDRDFFLDWIIRRPDHVIRSLQKGAKITPLVFFIGGKLGSHFDLDLRRGSCNVTLIRLPITIALISVNSVGRNTDRIMLIVAIQST